jgi:hypothetical protein
MPSPLARTGHGPPAGLRPVLLVRISVPSKKLRVSFTCGLLAKTVAQATFEIAWLVGFESLDIGDWLCMRTW